MTDQEARAETADQIAERYVAAFMGEGLSATVYRDRLVEMVANVAREVAGYRKHPEPKEIGDVLDGEWDFNDFAYRDANGEVRSTSDWRREVDYDPTPDAAPVGEGE